MRYPVTRGAIMAAALLLAPAARAELTSTQRAASFGMSDVRGVVYIPGPQGPAKPVDPSFNPATGLPMFTGQLTTYTPAGVKFATPLDAKFTIYNDSDFYNSDFAILWGAAGGRGRDDLRRFKTELNANYIRPYDWQSNPALRNHDSFLSYAAALGMRVSIPISSFTLKMMCENTGDWKKNVAGVFTQVYKTGTTANKGAGALEIFNEFDNFYCRSPKFVADVAQEWKRLEDARKVPDAQRLPIAVSVTFSLANGLPGGAILGVFNEIKARPALGLAFWRARMIHAVNTFNDGPFMRNWVLTDLPAWYWRFGIPSDTPVLFTEYGKTSEGVGEAAQATFVETQFASMWRPSRPAHFLGAMAFVPEFRFWEKAPEPNFAILNFNQGAGSWGKPATMFVQSVLYQNPNAPIGTRWAAKYQVDPQRPRQAYCAIGRVYFGGWGATPPPCP